ncbi:MAG: dipeptidase [Solobacterium sp.]|nr:dipeptidase [Solobacterium sp.]
MAYAIDMHCDTLMETLYRHGEDADFYDKPDQHLDVKRLIKGKTMAQFMAIFFPPDVFFREYMHREPATEEEHIAGCVKVLKNTLERYPELVRQAYNADDVERNFREGKTSLILTMEDGVAVHGDMKKLDAFYDLGVRALTLTWNFENCFGAPNSLDPVIMNKGLTDFGKEAVKHMQDIGMLVDVSHVSDGVFWDVYRLAKVPFVATHSNSRALCNHTRNMTDDMIRALAEKGGAMGLNIAPQFLDDTPENKESRIRDLVAMARHEKEVGGIGVVAIGTDFDGTGGNLELNGPDRMPALCDALIRDGFTADEVDLIMYGNVLRVMHEAMK